MRRSGSDKRARACTLSMRASEDEKRAITARANYHGVSVGAFLRQAALAQSLPRGKKRLADQGQFIALTLTALATIMDEVKRSEGEPAIAGESLALIERELLSLRDHCMSTLGRKP